MALYSHMGKEIVSAHPVSLTDSDISIESESKLVSDFATLISQWILFAVICQVIDVVGVVSNIVNIVCFVKQGFKDPVNVSLFGLTVSDLGCLVTQIATNIYFTPALISADLPFDPLSFQYITSGIPHVTITRVTAWITAFITLERCLCITAPLKVKTLVTPKRVAAIIICVFTILISSAAPMFVVYRLGMTFHPGRNKTLIGLVYAENRENIERVSFVINNFCVPFSAFVVITTCTVILDIKLRNITRWRKTSSAAFQAENVSIRNQKVAKMVVMISTLFIVCFLPMSVCFLAMALVPGFTVDGKYINIGVIFAGFCFVLESINSSVNIFIYYYMSSKYRETFRQIFCNDVIKEK